MSSTFLITHQPHHHLLAASSLSSSPPTSPPVPVWTEQFLIELRSDFSPSDAPHNFSNRSFHGDEYDLPPSNPDQSTLLLQVMNDYILPVIILLGIFGNTLSLIVYVSTPRLCRQTSSVYLAFLSGVDNAHLLFYCLVWFNFVGINIYHQNGWCQTTLYSMYVCNFLAAWTVVSFTGERWIIVFRPLLRRSLCTRKRAFKNMVFLTILALIMYSYSFFTAFVEDQYSDNPVCMETIKNEILNVVIRASNIVITILVPLVAIVTMNASIAIKIAKYTRVRRAEESKSPRLLMMEGLSSNFSYSNVQQVTRSSYKGRFQHQIHDRHVVTIFNNDDRRHKKLHSNFYSDYGERQFLTIDGVALAVPSNSLAATPAAASADVGVVGVVGKGHENNAKIFELNGRPQKRNKYHDAMNVRSNSCQGNDEGGMNRMSFSVGFPEVMKNQHNNSNNHDHRNTLMGSTQNQGTQNLRLKTRRQHTQLHITRSLLLVSSVFILLNLPSYAFHICGLVMSVRRAPGAFDEGSYPFLWDHFIQFIYCSNFSSRFFLYIGCSQHFRYALRRLACLFNMKKKKKEMKKGEDVDNKRRKDIDDGGR